MRTKRRIPAANRRRGRVPVLSVLTVVALLAGTFAVSCGASPDGGARQVEQPSEDPAVPDGMGNPTLGAADAPVEMIEWGDFR